MSDDWDDDYDDVEDDLDDDFHDAWYECPECGSEVFESADLCPACEQFIVPKLVARSDRKPVWWIVLAILGAIATVIVLLGVR